MSQFMCIMSIPIIQLQGNGDKKLDKLTLSVLGWRLAENSTRRLASGQRSHKHVHTVPRLMSMLCGAPLSVTHTAAG